MRKILVIGSINMDLVIKTKRVPQMGETITGSGFMTTCGGKGGNQAVAAARMGANVAMIGAVGSGDSNGERLLNNFKENGVNTDGISVVDGPSGIAVITVCKGNNCIILDEGANGKVTPEMIDRNIDKLEWCDTILLQFEIPIETVLYAAKLGKKLGKAVIINPAPMKEIPEELMRCCDLFVPNRTEAEIITGMKITTKHEAETAVKLIRAMGAESVVITMGGHGAIMGIRDKIRGQGIYRTNVVDTTAAGDTFVAGLAVRLADGIAAACDFAARASALTVSKYGAQTAMPTEKEIDALKAELVEWI